jgi:hypothetical protein
MANIICPNAIAIEMAVTIMEIRVSLSEVVSASPKRMLPVLMCVY